MGEETAEAREQQRIEDLSFPGHSFVCSFQRGKRAGCATGTDSHLTIARRQLQVLVIEQVKTEAQIQDRPHNSGFFDSVPARREGMVTEVNGEFKCAGRAILPEVHPPPQPIIRVPAGSKRTPAFNDIHCRRLIATVESED